MITSKRRIARMFMRHQRSLNAGLNDPMTEHYGAGEFVHHAAESRLRSVAREIGVSTSDMEDASCDYYAIQAAKRCAHRSQAQLAWKRAASMEREARMHEADRLDPYNQNPFV